MLEVKPGEEESFEVAFGKAQVIISSMDGYISHQLQRCLENPCKYVLLVNWETLEHHTESFRGSDEYKEWKTLLHHFYDPFPIVEHFELIYENGL